MSEHSPACRNSPASFSESRHFLILLALMAAALFYARLPCELLEPEEARYAEIPRQMLAEGRFITPVLHGEDYYQKPPLLYWLVMLSYRIFGVHDWAARLVPCTSGVLTVLLVYWWGRRLAGPSVGFAAGVILCLSARFLYLGDMLSMDSLLCLSVTAGLAFGHVGIVECSDRYWRLSALACGLGVLTKGPVALVLIAAPLGISSAFTRGPNGFGVRRWLTYLAITLVVAGPWFVAAALQNPQASGTFFWLHNFVRYIEPFDHQKPIWFYVPSLLVGTLPWSLLLIPAFLARAEGTGAHARFFALALCWCVLFFSLSGCKRAAYILPAFPALALWLGSYLASVVSSESRMWNPRRLSVVASCCFAVLLACTMLLLPSYHRRFGMRQQIQDQAALADNYGVFVYPKRWDSVSFYLQREVAILDMDRALPAGLVFVKREGALDRLLSAMPRDWEFTRRGRPRNVVVGVLGPASQAICSKALRTKNAN